MRIALLGASGQLGTALSRELAHDDIVPLTSAGVDVANAGQVAAALEAARPEIVVNAAAYNFVDKAEDEPERTFAVNALGPRNLAAWCGRHDIPLVHVSTDYVFGLDAARQTPYGETDVPGPLSAYSVSKFAGEAFVQSLCPRHFVIRTCGLYGRAASPGKGNFVETMLRLGRERDALTVVDDQWCTPTSASDLAGAIRSLIGTGQFGLYHVTNVGSTTWCRFALEIFRLARIATTVRAVSSAEYPAKARRPAYSVLDTSKFQRAVGRRLPAWQDALSDYLASRGDDARG